MVEFNGIPHNGIMEPCAILLVEVFQLASVLGGLICPFTHANSVFTN